MDQPEFIYPPNKPLERLPLPSKTPVLYDYIFFIDVNEDEEFLLGCSNINGQYWEGTLYYYKDCTSALKFEHTGHYISTSTTSDAKFMQFDNENHIVIAEDSGMVKLLSACNIDNGVLCLNSVFYANAPVKQFAVWKNSSTLLTSADKTVALWDLQQNKGNPLLEYKDYHTSRVTSVDTNKDNANLFASASTDRRACIWDTRMEFPATVLYQNEFAALTSITWNPLHLDNLLVGSEGGDVYLLDIRQPKDFVMCHHCFNAGVHRMVCNSLGQTAVCGDISKIFVLSEDIIDEIYTSSVHSDFVRGLAWSNNVLYSCGFDRAVKKHII